MSSVLDHKPARRGITGIHYSRVIAAGYTPDQKPFEIDGTGPVR